MSILGLAAVTAAFATITASSAFAGVTLQGPQPTGVAPPSLDSGQPVVTGVTLPSGEAVNLRRRGAR